MSAEMLDGYAIDQCSGLECKEEAQMRQWRSEKPFLLPRPCSAIAVLDSADAESLSQISLPRPPPLLFSPS